MIFHKAELGCGYLCCGSGSLGIDIQFGGCCRNSNYRTGVDIPCSRRGLVCDQPILLATGTKAVQPYQLAFDYKTIRTSRVLADARLGFLERIRIHHVTLLIAQLCHFDRTYSSARLCRRRPPQPGPLRWTARCRLFQRCLGKDQHGNNHDRILWAHMPRHLNLLKELWRPDLLCSAGRNCLRAF
jgi:hypothetical protein